MTVLLILIAAAALTYTRSSERVWNTSLLLAMTVGAALDVSAWVYIITEAFHGH